ncbi:hypothetical protein C8P66_112145 [Humitalea rosea]|uniref:CENP-V/GFA domain-containing protein n=1 Tax=Humitalea rosea TaxID=990373 RepID=A0A2W7IEV6_9PROT|nr:GFA family protein [Humitalea rosea]PZW45128.1 hypothetical protein C8P66_112145 [Humitalea rosea]
MSDSTIHSGGCNCGALRLEARGAPKRVGLCHCQTCRRQSGSAYSAFVVWDRDRVTISGPAHMWRAATEQRHFCPNCGAPVFALDGGPEIEVRLGCLDAAPSGLVPGYELWVGRREHWAVPVEHAAQYPRNRDDGGSPPLSDPVQ